MNNLILIHQNEVQHYRVQVYNYLFDYLLKNGFNLKILSKHIQKNNTYEISFPFYKLNLNLFNLIKLINKQKPDAIIFFVNLKNLYLFPILFYSKIIGIKTIYWGHAIDLQDKYSKIKNILYNIEHILFDAIILYANHLKKYVKEKYHYKVFIANNTLNITSYKSKSKNKKTELLKYNIKTHKNIIYVGRLQKRKRINDLILAFRLLNRKDVGLILVGQEVDVCLREFELKDENIYKLGPLYGNKVLDLLSASDIYCMPGAVGLSIVDAFYCGLPLVSEKVDHGPEIMYFKEGTNGFMVEKGNYKALAEKIRVLLDDDKLREQFSKAAKKEIETNGNINNLCEGFLDSLNYLFFEKKRCFSTNKRRSFI